MQPFTTRVRAVCYGMGVLGIVCAAAGSGCTGAPRHGVGTADVPRGSAALSFAASHAAPPSAGSPRQIALADPQLASTATKRQQLTYLVQCALPEDVTLYADQGTERFTFQGQMGLAPRWLSEAMTPSEERWVSACLLARVNYFGKRVVISLRATPAPVPALEASDDEQQTFTIFEGGFFGNLFLPNPVAYACRGEHTPAQTEDPVLQDRICTQETGATTADGTPITPCRFLLTGRCEDDHSFTVDGTHYTEVVFTYLRPSHHE